MQTITLKESVVAAGRRLLHEGLVERTWGNVSVRLNEKSFAVTPSGSDYEKLIAEDIVSVSISDLSYSGNIKPSSECAIHAALYKLYPEVNFIIHTHQKNASILGIKRNNIQVCFKEEAEFLGCTVPAADYAEAGSKEIAENIVKVLSDCKAKAVLMPYHGAVCFGKDENEAFKTAAMLELLCGRILETEFKSFDLNVKPFLKFYSSRRENGLCVIYCPKTARVLCKVDIKNEEIVYGKFCGFAQMHIKIYQAKAGINFIVQGSQKASVYLSRIMEKMTEEEKKSAVLPFFEDFAQIAGDSTGFVKITSEGGNVLGVEKLLKTLEKADAAIVSDGGVLCCGETFKDAVSVSSIYEKNAAAVLLALSNKDIHPMPQKQQRNYTPESLMYISK